ncbi:hypothetical protein [Aquimarina sp. SS2-1]|uniref:hypothetical protein n=1 Tax=Aquimarina besae TaxID=3342247 RepID=UPI003672AB3D
MKNFLNLKPEVKPILKPLTLLFSICILLLAVTSCNDESISDVEQIQQVSLENPVKHTPTEQTPSYVQDAVGSLDFQKLSSKFQTKANNQSDFSDELLNYCIVSDNGTKKSYTYAFEHTLGNHNYNDKLVINEDSGEIKNISILRYEPTENYILNVSEGIAVPFSGNITRFNLTDDSYQTITIENGVQQKLLQKNSGCIRYDVFEIFELTTTHNGVVTTTYEAEFVESVYDCSETNEGGGTNDDGSTGGSGGSGSGNTNNYDSSNDNVLTVPPSCKSFEYQQFLDNTQVCATRNIRFNIVTLVNGNFREVVTITMNQPIYFITPRFSSLQGNLTNGQGANLTAQAVQATTNYLVGLHIATGYSESQLRALFMQTLNENLATIMPGSAASISPFSGLDPIPVTEYQTTMFLNDNCR